MNARHKHADVSYRLEQEEEADGSELGEIGELRFHLDLAERDLADAADTISSFTAVDGAVILSTSLRVLGFGAEILLQDAPPCTVYETDDWMHTDDARKVDSESFGMRHRSATRFVGATIDTCAVIVSQDGRVSFCWKQGDRVLLKRDVNTSNPNIVGA